MEKLEKFVYEGNEITFLTGENMMINATQMAKKFNAKPESWLRTDNSQRMIDAFTMAHNCAIDDLVRIDTNKMQKSTWMHEDIALLFAQWLSPEFYFWCNDRIKELFKYGITAAQESTREIVFKLSEATSRFRDNGFCKIGKYKIYELLRLKGILDEHNKPVSEYINKGYFGYKPYGKNSLSKYPIVTEEGFKWLNQTLFPEQSDFNAEEIKSIRNDLNLIKEGIGVLVETLLYNKGGKHTDDKNRENIAHLNNLLEKIRFIPKALN